MSSLVGCNLPSLVRQHEDPWLPRFAHYGLDCNISNMEDLWATVKHGQELSVGQSIRLRVKRQGSGQLAASRETVLARVVSPSCRQA